MSAGSSPSHAEARVGSRPGAELPLGLVFNIMRFSLHDGPGIRTTVFLKGCPLRCDWCHNPESQLPWPEVAVLEDRCVRSGACVRACPNGAIRWEERPVLDLARCRRCGQCAEACLAGARQRVGRWMTVEEVLGEVSKDRVFFDESGGGVTVSGGEPLMQPAFVLAFLAACRRGGLRTVLETCGFADAEVVRRAAENVDLFLYDLKLMDAERHRRFTGASNARILRNLAMLAERGAAIIVRVPIVPGVNDTEADADALMAFLDPLGVRRVDLLPYHRFGSDKYRRLAHPYRMEGVEPPATRLIDQLTARFAERGYLVRIGG
jgi:pyruvate formate lyase activating enzyme